MKNNTSLRQLAKQLGVSASYISQVKNGKRPPSQKLLSNAAIRRMLTVKQNVKHEVDDHKCKSYNMTTRQRSSGVEQRTHKPLVGGSNPPAATYYIFWFFCIATVSKYSKSAFNVLLFK